MSHIVVVVGHTKCGGVAAAYDAACSGGQSDEGEFWSICLSVLFLGTFRILFIIVRRTARHEISPSIHSTLPIYFLRGTQSNMRGIRYNDEFPYLFRLP